VSEAKVDIIWVEVALCPSIRQAALSGKLIIEFHLMEQFILGDNLENGDSKMKKL
jgi:hypothetical protein